MAKGCPLPTRPINAPAKAFGSGAPVAVREGEPAERARSLPLLDSCTSPVVLNDTLSPRRTRSPVDTQPAVPATRIDPGESRPGSRSAALAPPEMAATGYVPRYTRATCAI